jgi:cytochrome P450
MVKVERVHNPFWLGTPHVASEDFVYQGKFIPKDTVVVLNTWTMHHDDTRYPEPEKFDVSSSLRHATYDMIVI